MSVTYAMTVSDGGGVNGVHISAHHHQTGSGGPESVPWPKPVYKGCISSPSLPPHQHCSSCGAEVTVPHQLHHVQRSTGSLSAPSPASSVSSSPTVIASDIHVTEDEVDVDVRASDSSTAGLAENNVDDRPHHHQVESSGGSLYSSMPNLLPEDLNCHDLHLQHQCYLNHHQHQGFLDDRDLLTLLHGSDPIKAELDRLENELRAKDREISEFQAEIKALKLNERARERALEELADELARMRDKLERSELLHENKNLEIKRLQEERKEAQAAQFAVEATLRRLHASCNMKDEEDIPPIEAILAPLESELKLARQEISRLQDENRTLDRHTKAKEAALLEAEQRIDYAIAKATLVDDLNNRNQELTKQIEIYQEENKLLDKLHKQKITEIEKLSSNVVELEEQILSSASHADNVSHDFQRQLNHLEEEKKTLQRELARANVAANRVATVAANGWRDSHNQVMPVRHWLEERRFFQGEIQQLREKLGMMERTAKVEAQLKEKVQLRLKVLEESLIITKAITPKSNAHNLAKNQVLQTNNKLQPSRLSLSLSNPTTNCQEGKKATTPTRLPLATTRNNSIASKLLQNKVDGKSMAKSFNITSNGHMMINTKSSTNHNMTSISIIGRSKTTLPQAKSMSNYESFNRSSSIDDNSGNHLEPIEDYVSGQLYDQLQKEVITLRKACQEKDRGLQDKENAIEILEKKVNALQRSMELEAKRMRREVANIEKGILKRANDNNARNNKGAMSFEGLSNQTNHSH